MKQIINNSVLLIIFTISIPLFALAQDIKFKQISSREFSPIVQDHEGYLWFGATDLSIASMDMSIAVLSTIRRILLLCLPIGCTIFSLTVTDMSGLARKTAA